MTRLNTPAAHVPYMLGMLLRYVHREGADDVAGGLCDDVVLKWCYCYWY